MKQIAASLFTALFFVSLVHAVQVGEPESEVTRAWGKPGVVLKKADGTQVWKFRDGTTVWLAVEGNVQKIEQPDSYSVVRPTAAREAVASSANTKSETTAPTTAAATPVAASDRAIADIRKVGYYVFFAALAGMVATRARYVVSLFRGTPVWRYS